MTALTEEIRKRREEARKRRELVNKHIDLMIPTIKHMQIGEIESFLNEVQSTINLKFHPFRTFSQAISYRKGK